MTTEPDPVIEAYKEDADGRLLGGLRPASPGPARVGQQSPKDDPALVLHRSREGGVPEAA